MATDIPDRSLSEQVRQLLAEHTGQSPESFADDDIAEYIREWMAKEDEHADLCLNHRFERQVEKSPERQAVMSEAGAITYGELNARANRLAHYLLDCIEGLRGADSQVVMGICMKSSPDLVVCILGVIKAGGAFVLIDPDAPAARLNTVIRETGAALLLTHEEFIDKFSKSSALIIAVDRENDEICRRTQDNPRPPLFPESPAQILSLSGKSIVAPHLAICNRMQWMQDEFGLSEADRVLSKTPSPPEVAVLEILWPLLYGAQVVTAEPDRGDMTCLQNAILRQGVSVLSLTPTGLAEFLDSLDNWSGDQISSLRLVFCSGGLLRQKLINRFTDHFNCQLYNFYCLPELSSEVAFTECKAGDEREVAPVGYPTTAAVYILDKHMRPVPPGVSGEAYVEVGPQSHGYLKDAVGTAMRFLPDPFTEMPGGRLFKTGDIGRRMANNALELQGSSGRDVWLNGLKIDLSQIEAAILADPTIDDCFVSARDTEQGAQELVAYVVAPGSFSSDQLKSYLGSVLTKGMLPAAFVPVSAIPLTPAGQVDERALTKIEIIDAALAQAWEESLRAIPEIGDAAVEVQEHTVRLDPLHLSELLLDWKPFPISSGGDPSTSPAPPDATQGEDEPAAIAFCDGGPLVIEDDAPTTLTEALIRTAARHNRKGITYILQDGGTVFQSYPSLLEEARRILAGLYDKGLKSGNRIILQMPSLKDHFTAFWACVLGGITPVTVAIAPSYEANNSVVKKLYNTWELLDRPAVLTGDELVESITGLSRVLPMEDLKVLSVSALRDYHPGEQIYQSKPDDLVFFQLTSGSTGTPKCIQETHRGIIAHIHGSKQFNDYTADNVSLNWLPVDHVVPILTYHLKDVYLGCNQVQVKTEAVLADPLKWLDLIEAHKVTHTWSPNFGFKLVADQLRKQHGKRWDLSSVKFFMNAGEQVTLPVVGEFLRHAGEYNLQSQAMQPAFGMAEVCTCMTYQNHFDLQTGVDRFDKRSLSGRLRKAESADTEHVSFIHLGPPIPGVQIRIADKDNRLVPEAVIGRLQIKGQVVTPGYYNNAEANEEAFVGDGWFNTGDLGYILDGHLTITGREKEMIIINGANYYCYEIEDIVNRVEGVEPTYVAACGLDDSRTGTEALAIFFSPTGAGENDRAGLIRKIRSETSKGIGITPEYIVPVPKAEFPKTTSGKIQRTQLKKGLSQGQFDETLKQIDILLENECTLPDWFYTRAWREREAVTLVNPDAGSQFLVFADRVGLGTRLGEKLTGAGYGSILVEPSSEFARLDPSLYRINPAEPEHYVRLLESISENGAGITHAIHLWTYGEPAGEVAGIEALKTAQEEGAYSLLFLIQALTRVNDGDSPVRLYVVSSNVQPALADDHVSFEKATLLGIARTGPQEIPWLSCRHLDLKAGDEELNSDRILRELYVAQGDSEIAYRDRRRLVPRLQKVVFRNQEKQPLPFKRGGMYLLSGGLGGIGVEVARLLATRYEAKLLLIGRTALPGRDEWESRLGQATTLSSRIKNYLDLERLGGEIAYESVDLCDLTRLIEVVERAKSRWGCDLDGIIHLAGVYQERLLTDETREGLEEMFQAKVFGTWTLHQLLKMNRGTLFISASSVNGTFGGFGVGAYAAASSFLDHLSYYQRSESSLRSYCLAWSLWDEVGMGRNRQMKDLVRSRGYLTVGVKRGLNALLVGLSQDLPHLLVGLDGSNKRIRRLIESGDYRAQELCAYITPATASLPLAKLKELEVRDRFNARSACEFSQIARMPLKPDKTIDRAALRNGARVVSQSRTAYVPPQTETEQTIATIWREVLKADRVGLHDNFFEMGGHSLAITQARLKIQTAFNRDVSIVEMFKYPTISLLASLLSKQSVEAPTFQQSYERAGTRKQMAKRQMEARARPRTLQVVNND